MLAPPRLASFGGSTTWRPRNLGRTPLAPFRPALLSAPSSRSGPVPDPTREPKPTTSYSWALKVITYRGDGAQLTWGRLPSFSTPQGGGMSSVDSRVPPGMSISHFQAWALRRSSVKSFIPRRRSPSGRYP